MSKILTINTEAGLVKEETLEPLPLYNEHHPMLTQSIPEYDLRTLPNPVMTKLVKRLKMTMKMYSGLGLSANQCGVFERVFVIGNDDVLIPCINPKVIKVSEKVDKNNEGCLSFPGLFLKIERPVSVDVEFYDENGKLHNATFEGLTARCFLHELDHMNGIRMVQYSKPLALQMARQKQQKLIKKVKRLQKDNGTFV
jgi:peptide deformylase